MRRAPHVALTRLSSLRVPPQLSKQDLRAAEASAVDTPMALSPIHIAPIEVKPIVIQPIEVKPIGSGSPIR